MQGGAYDFFEKPLKIEDILISLGEAARRATRWSSLYSRHSLSAKRAIGCYIRYFNLGEKRYNQQCLQVIV
jgi:hypothetical protein